MPPRPYRSDRRAALHARTRARIVRATVDLHARHGALGTSYADIAERAQVAPQTVYNHFPTLGELLQGCTGHVLAQAPVVDAASFAAGRTPAQRLQLLAQAAYAQVEYLAPWLRLGWYEAQVVPELGAILGRGAAQLRDLVAAAAGRSTPAFLDAAQLLLSYPGWLALARGRSRAAAARLAGDGLVALHKSLASPKESP